MSPKFARRLLIVAALSIAVLFSKQSLLSSATLSSANKKSVYSVIYQMLSVDIGRGQTVTIPVQVAPTDLPGIFALTTNDNRLLISGFSSTGVLRTITIKDQTAVGDGTANTPESLSVGMYFPDGSQVVTSSGQPIQASINLKKTFLEYVQQGASIPGNSIQSVIDRIPIESCNGIGSGVISALNTVATNNSQPSLNQAQRIAALDLVNQQFGPYCNQLGDEMGSSVRVAVNSMPPSIANTLIGRGEIPPTPTVDQSISVALAGFSFNSNGNVALTYSPGEFLSTSSPWFITTAPITTRASQLQVNAVARSANFSGGVSGSCTLNYNDGTFRFAATNQITIQLNWKWGP